jgi:hypothetical protein
VRLYDVVRIIKLILSMFTLMNSMVCFRLRDILISMVSQNITKLGKTYSRDRKLSSVVGQKLTSSFVL